MYKEDLYYICTQHCHQYLIKIAVGALQSDATIINVQIVTLVGSKFSEAIRVLKFQYPLVHHLVKLLDLKSELLLAMGIQLDPTGC